MAKITLKIRANNGQDGEIYNKGANKAINNVSKPLNEPTTPNNGVNGKSLALGYLSLSDGFLGGHNTRLQSEVHKYNGYMFGATDNNGKYNLEITLTGSNIKSLLVRFDKEADQYATTAILDNNNTIYNSNNVWNIVFAENSSTHTITFTDWNRANYNACLTGIDILTEYISYNKNYIDSVSSTAQSTSDGRVLSYGVTANTGSADLLDRNNDIIGFIEQGIIPSSNLGVEVFVNDKQIQAHIATDSDYDTVGQTFTIQFTNDISQWDKITYSGRPLQYDESDNVISATAWELLVEIMGDLGYSESDIQAMCEDGVEQTLKDLNIPYPYLDSDTYRATIDKICTLAQLNVFASELNTPLIVNARPIITSTDKGWLIPTSYQITALSEDVILRNQYDGVDIEKSTPSVNIDQRALVFSDKALPVGYLINSNNQNVSGQGTAIVSPEKYPLQMDVFVKSYYTNISITIPKKIDNNFSSITNLLSETDASGNPNIKYQVNYKKDIGTARTYGNNRPTSINDVSTTRTSTSYGTGNIPTSYEYKKKVCPDGADACVLLSATTSFNDLSDNKRKNPFTEDEDNYYLTLLLLCGGKYVGVYGERYPNVLADYTPLDGQYEEYIPETIDISIYGNKQTISFSKTLASTDNITQATTPAKVQSNELMQTDEIVNGIKANILDDYSNGIKTARIDTFCGDFKNALGEQMHFDEGDVIKPHDIVALAGDKDRNGAQRYWRVIGREFKYSGQPTVSLQLQGAKYWHTVFEGELNIVPNYIGNVVTDTTLAKGVRANLKTIVSGVVSYDGIGGTITNMPFDNISLPDFIKSKVPSARLSVFDNNALEYVCNTGQLGTDLYRITNIRILNISQYY